MGRGPENIEVYITHGPRGAHGEVDGGEEAEEVEPQQRPRNARARCDPPGERELREDVPENDDNNADRPRDVTRHQAPEFGVQQRAKDQAERHTRPPQLYPAR